MHAECILGEEGAEGSEARALRVLSSLKALRVLRALKALSWRRKCSHFVSRVATLQHECRSYIT